MGTMIGIHQQAGVITTYVAEPAPDVQCRGAIIVIHDIWGVTDHIKSVADRLAAAGYFAIAPSLLFVTPVQQKQAADIHAGLTSADPSKRDEAMRKFRQLLASMQTPQFGSQVLSRLEVCFEYAYGRPAARQRVGVVGFGFGGAYTFALAVRNSRLRAAVPFYGHTGYLELELRHIACPILAFYGGKDSLAQEVPKLTEHMNHAGVRFTPVVYDEAGTSFFNESNPDTYNRRAAEDAWHRLVNFLRVSML